VESEPRGDRCRAYEKIGEGQARGGGLVSVKKKIATLFDRASRIGNGETIGGGGRGVIIYYFRTWTEKRANGRQEKKAQNDLLLGKERDRRAVEVHPFGHW